MRVVALITLHDRITAMEIKTILRDQVLPIVQTLFP